MTDQIPIPPPDAGGLRRRIYASARLSSLQFVSSIALRLVSTVVLTRLLAPEIYGVFAVVLVYRYLLEMFSDLGIRSVILTKEGETDAVFLRTCWTVSILRGAVISAVSAAIAAVIAALQAAGFFSPDSAYSAHALPLAIAALGGVSLLMSMQSVNRYVAERDMVFGRVTAGMILSNVAGLVATITLAYLLRSVWALVLGAYVQTAVLVVFSFLAFRGPAMRPAFDRTAFGLVISRGKWIMGHSILTAVAGAADRLLLGFVMSSSTFGFYFIARQIIEIGNSFLISVHAQMGLQVFTHILQDTPEGFRANYYRYRLFFDVLAGLGAGGMFVLAPTLVDLVFDDRYREVGPMVRLLVFGLVLIGPLVLREAYSAERRFRKMTVLSLMSATTLWTGLLLATFVFQSFTGALLVIALYRLPETVTLWWLGYRRGWVRPAREALIVLFFAAGMAVGWIVLQVWEAVWPGL